MSDAGAFVRLDAPSLGSRRFRARRVARAILLELGARLRHGRVEVWDGDEHFTRGVATPELPISVSIRVVDPRFWLRVLIGGSVAAGESYVDGDWTTDDLVGLMRIFARNADVLSDLEGRFARLSAPARRFLHFLRRNTPAGSRRNVAAHYDLGNDFYALFLDETLSYSCAVFERPDDSLERAQLAKLELICQKLRLAPSDHLLEIGCGWGALAIHAARNHGVRVTAATISRAQFDFARARVRELGLDSRIEVVLADYRELSGRYDKVASIEMIEAIGHEYYEAYFRKLDQLLAPGGLALIQTITIGDDRFDAAKAEVDFIKRHIFPGSTIPSLAALRAAMRPSALREVDLRDLTLDYARTLRAWRERFVERANEVRALGRDERFMRLWTYYLALCEGGFSEGYIGDVQLLLQKAPPRNSSFL